uniref:Seipin n=1 Tax=Globisporangium ultimum (strain ATCC 200006 / CBS 805.95 / DAOM BR144) TaxID=431595 RepID=K3WY91_GLOUD
MAANWIPWTLLLSLLPARAANLMKEEERERRRDELVMWLQDFSQWLAHWSVRLAQLTLGISFLFATATILYSLLYYLVIPSRLHEQEIFFDYGNHASLVAEGSGLGHQLTLPTAKLNLLDPVHQWNASPVVKLPAHPQQVLVPGVKYDIYIELTVPESRVNADIGMFMVSTTLKSTDGQYLASSARSAIVHDSHSLVRWIRVGALAVLHALGLTEPAQVLDVLAINGIMESKTHPLTTAEITLNHPAIQIYSAKLTIIAQLSGVRYLMYHWSVSTAVLVILNIVFLEAVALVIIYAFYNLPAAEEEICVGVDQGQLFEQHRSGGIPPIHVERKIKTEPIETSTLIDEAMAAAVAPGNEDDEEMKLRYRSDVSIDDS